MTLVSRPLRIGKRPDTAVCRSIPRETGVTQGGKDAPNPRRDPATKSGATLCECLTTLAFDHKIAMARQGKPQGFNQRSTVPQTPLKQNSSGIGRCESPKRRDLVPIAGKIRGVSQVYRQAGNIKTPRKFTFARRKTLIYCVRSSCQSQDAWPR